MTTPSEPMKPCVHDHLTALSRRGEFVLWQCGDCGDVTTDLYGLFAPAPAALSRGAETGQKNQTLGESGRRAAMDACLAGMMRADPDLYERILETPGFAYYFNRLSCLARGDFDPAPSESTGEGKAD